MIGRRVIENCQNKNPILLIVLCVILLLCSFIVSRGRTLNFSGDKPKSIASDAIEEYDPAHPCGVVSATIITHILSRPVDFSLMSKVIPVDGLGRVSMIDLIGGLRKVGFYAAGVRLDNQSLKRIQGLPVILYVNRSHFLVIIPTEHKGMVVIDPPYEPYIADWNSVSFQWTGEAILVKNSNEEIKEILTTLGIKDWKETTNEDR